MKTDYFNNPNRTHKLLDFISDEKRRDALEAREKNRRDLEDIELGGFMRGRKKGREEGLEEGLEKGLEKGREEGIQIGLERGKISLALQFLARNTKTVIPVSIQEELEAIEDPEVLKETLFKIMTISSLAEVERLMAEIKSE